MYRILVLTVLFIVSVAMPNENGHKCRKLGHPDSLNCCKSGKLEPDLSPDVFQECIETPHIPQSCGRDLCIAKKRGYVSNDGTINKVAFEDILAKDFKNFPGLATIIKEKCLGDVEKYGSPHICQVTKMNRCMREHFFIKCTEWDNSGNDACDDLRELAQECAAMSN